MITRTVLPTPGGPSFDEYLSIIVKGLAYHVIV